MGEGTVEEPIGHSHPVGCLLAYASDHLRQIDVGSLGSTESHDQRSVVLWQLLDQHLTGFVSHLTELLVQVRFQRLLLVAACLKSQLTLLIHVDHFVAIIVANLQHLVLLNKKTWKWGYIVDSNGHSVV
jgi:hypothetical protein